MRIPVINKITKQYGNDDPIELLQLPKPIELALKKRNIHTVGKLYRRKRRKLIAISNLGPKSVKYLMKVKRWIFLKKSYKEKDNNQTPSQSERNNAIVSYKNLLQDFSHVDTSTVAFRKSISRNDNISVLNLPTRLENSLVYGGIETVGQFYNIDQKYFLKIRNVGPRSINYLLLLRKQLDEANPNLKSINSVESAISTVSNKNNSLTYVFNGMHLSGNEKIELLDFPTRIGNALAYSGIETIKMLLDQSPKELIKLRNIGPRSITIINDIKSKISPREVEQEEEKNIIDREKRNIEQEIPNEKLIDAFLERCKDKRAIEIMKRRYGLNSGERETLEEIGNSYGITRERIRQIQEKAIKKLRHPMVKEKNQIIELVEEVLWKNHGIISEEEADQLLSNIFKNIPYDGSSLLDLLADIGWIQTHKVGDAPFYSPKFSGLNLSVLMTEIIQLLKSNGNLMNVESIAKNLSCKTIEVPAQYVSQNAGSETTLNRSAYNRNYTVYEQKDVMSSDKLIHLVSRCCKLDPRIEERITNHFTLYSLHNRRHIWSVLISQILEKEGIPLHFTEIANRVNDLLREEEKYLDERKVYSLLIETSIFAHTGVRGMYGLTKWGLRKESTQELAIEFIEKSGFPVHWEQIFFYVSKYKDTRRQSIRNILSNSEKFIKKNDGFYWIKNNQDQIQRMKKEKN